MNHAKTGNYAALFDQSQLKTIINTLNGLNISIDTNDVNQWIDAVSKSRFSSLISLAAESPVSATSSSVQDTTTTSAEGIAAVKESATQPIESYPFSFTNNSGVDAENINFVILCSSTEPGVLKTQYLSFNPEGSCKFNDGPTVVTLSELPKDASGNYQLNLPSNYLGSFNILDTENFNTTSLEFRIDPKDIALNVAIPKEDSELTPLLVSLSATDLDNKTTTLASSATALDPHNAQVLLEKRDNLKNMSITLDPLIKSECNISSQETGD